MPNLDQPQYQHRFRGFIGKLSNTLVERVDAKSKFFPKTETPPKPDKDHSPEPVGLGDTWIWHDPLTGWYITANRDDEARARRHQMGIPQLYAGMRLSTYTTPTTDHQKYLEQVNAWLIEHRHHARQPQQCEHSLLVTGNTGSGKTHLAVGIIIEWLGFRLKPYFVDARDMFENIRSAFNRDGHNPISEYCQYDALLIDDFGANEKIQPLQKDRICQVITARINDMRPTIITSNLCFPMDWHPLVDDRVISRMQQAFKIIQWGQHIPDWRVSPPRASKASRPSGEQGDLPF